MARNTFSFNKEQYKAVRKALSELKKQTRQMAYGSDNLLEKGATTYKYAVRSAIINQTFPISYRGYSNAYKKWKAKAVPHLGLPSYWRLSGSVLKNLTVKKTGKGVVCSGLMVNRAKRTEPYRAKSSRSKNPYRQPATMMTNATSYAVFVNNIRPLFRPVFESSYNKITQKIEKNWKGRIRNIWG